MNITLSQKDLDAYFGNTPNYDFLEASMVGLKKVFAHRMSQFVDDPQKIFWAMTTDWRSTMLMRKKTKPPFIRLGIAGVAINSTIVNIKAMARSGVFARDPGTVGGGAGDLQEVKPFPVTVRITGHYVDRDAMNALRAGSYLMLLGQATGGLSFVIHDDRFAPYEVIVRSDNPEFTAPGDDQWVDLETEGSEETQGFEFTLTMNTLMMLLKRTPQVRAVAVTTTTTQAPVTDPSAPPPTREIYIGT